MFTLHIVYIYSIVYTLFHMHSTIKKYVRTASHMLHQYLPNSQVLKTS